MSGSIYPTPGIFWMSARATSSRIRVGALFPRNAGPRRSPGLSSRPFASTFVMAIVKTLLPKTRISLNRSRARNRESMLRCNPRPNETIVTITATPTITPIEVSVARNFASRRFRKDSFRRSVKDIAIRRLTGSRLTHFLTARNRRNYGVFRVDSDANRVNKRCNHISLSRILVSSVGHPDLPHNVILKLEIRSMKTPRHLLTRIFAAFALVFTVSAAAVAKKNSDNNAFSKIKISNFGQMDERFYRGARPKQKDFQALKDLGINTIIDLTDNTPEERGYAEAVGLKYVNIAIPDKKDPSDAQVAQFLKVVDDPATGKFYVHCAGGRHRTGVMGAIYRFKNYHWNFDQVYNEMLKFDFYTSNGHGGQKTYVENYARHMQSEIATPVATQGSK